MINFGNIERRPYLGSREIGEVWLGSVKVYPDNSEPPVPDPYEEKYLTFEALEGGSRFSFSRAGLDYSTDGGTTWSSLTEDSYTPSIVIGQKIMFKGQMQTSLDTGIGQFTSTGRFNIEGNIMSLLFGDDFKEQKDLTGYNYTLVFKNIFKDTDAVDASNLVLPATALSQGCYSGMFDHCERLTAAPALPATTLESHCYEDMFYYCTSLTTAPELPATTLTSECYRGMFRGCTSLTTAPELPATIMVYHCYIDMFQNCKSLTNAPALPAMTLAEGCYSLMFAGCTSLVAAPELPATELAPYCYESMFEGCTVLTETPVLPATTLVEYCYNYMFRRCTSLTTAPELPAKQIANNCYDSMFEGCTNLTEAPVLPSLILSSYCYYQMFKNCSSLSRIECHATDISASYCTTDWTLGVSSTGTFVKSASMTSWTTGYDGIPEGWTTVNA